MATRATLIKIAKQSDLEINVFSGALALSKWAEPGLNIDPYHRHGEALVRALKAYIGTDHQIEAVTLDGVRQIIAKRYGFDIITNPSEQAEPINFAHTIERRRGCSLTLCLLYLYVLDRVGLRVDMLDFPARPLVRVWGQNQHIIIDPARQGKRVDASHMRSLYVNDQQDTVPASINPFAVPVLSRRHALLRIQDDLKLHMLRQNAPEAALAAIEAGLLIAPNEPRLWHEIGVLHARLDHTAQSIAALKHFLSFPTNERQRYSASQLLQSLQQNKDA